MASDFGSDEVRHWLHDTVANQPLTWLNIAQDLKRSADLLIRSASALHDSLDHHARRGHWTSYHLLMAFSFENLTKGVSIVRARGADQPYEQARNEWKHDSGHGFSQLAESFGGAAPVELRMLRKLQEFAIWAGRYPIANKVGRFSATHWLEGDLFLEDQELDAVQPLFSRWEQEVLATIPTP